MLKNTIVAKSYESESNILLILTTEILVFSENLEISSPAAFAIAERVRFLKAVFSCSLEFLRERDVDVEILRSTSGIWVQDIYCDVWAQHF